MREGDLSATLVPTGGEPRCRTDASLGVPRHDTVISPVRVIARRLLYDTTLAALIAFLVLLFCVTVLAVRGWGDAHGLPRLGVAATPLIAEFLFLVAVFVRSHLKWMRR